MRYEARSASSRTDDWPEWMVWDCDKGLNVTGSIARANGDDFPEGAVFTSKNNAQRISTAANERIAP